MRVNLGPTPFPLVGVAEYLTDEDRQELSVAGNQVVGFQQARPDSCRTATTWWSEGCLSRSTASKR